MTEMNTMSWPAKLGLNLLALLVSVCMFFPIFWLVLTSFKTNALAGSRDPALLFSPTLTNYVSAIVDKDYFHYALNSLLTSVGSTVICMALAVPAAYSMVFRRSKYTDGTLLWMPSIKIDRKSTRRNSSHVA